jgi:murein DD-endopeptidase MepM/ murein hydrolase activator NlpD
MKFKWPIATQHRWISGYRFTPPSHDGIDYGTPTGADYTSPQDGIVKTARFTLAQNVTGQQYGYGNYLEINHGNGWVSLAAHLLEGYVKVGEAVKMGQLVAKTDNNGHQARIYILC